MNLRRLFLPLSMSAGLALVVFMLIYSSHRSHAAIATEGQPQTAAPQRVVAEGHVTTYPGGTVEIGSEMAGLIISLPVFENSIVEKGSLIAELKSDDLRASLDEAKARLEEYESEEILAVENMDRNQRLSTNGAISVQEKQLSERDLSVVRARKASAKATIARIESELAKTKIYAPFTGTVLRRSVEQGQVINSHAALITLANLSKLRIDAEVDEFDSGRVHVGQSVQITAEGMPGVTWKGIVEEVPDVVVEKGLEPRDPSRPIDVRVLRAKIAISEKTPLKLGQRVELEISCADTSSQIVTK